MMMHIAIALIFLIATFQSVASLTYTNATYRFYTIEIGSQRMEIAALDVEFNEDVFLKFNGSSTPMGQINGKMCPDPQDPNNCFPSIMFSAAGLAELRCQGTSPVSRVPAQSYPTGQFNGPPPFMMLIKPTNEPASTVMSLFSGFSFPEQYIPNRISFAFILNGQENGAPLPAPFDITKPAFQSCKPQLMFPGQTPQQQPASQLVDKNNNPFTGGVNFPPAPAPVAPCSYSNMNSLKSAFEAFLNAGNNVGDKMTVNSLTFSIASFTSRNAYQGCTQLLNEMMIMGNTTVSCRLILF